MKSTRIFFFLILALVVGFSSCKKEEVSETIKIQEEIKPEVTTDNPLVYSVKRTASTNTSSANGGLDLECFSIDFPFDLIVDGNVVNINSEDDFNDAINSATQSLDFGYPLNITYPDGETDVIDDGEELGEAFASCVPTGGWGNDDFPAYLICDLNSCYQLVYPVDLVDGDGNTYTANDETEFVDLIITHPELYFVFPISLLDADGETVVANNSDDLFQLLTDCGDINNPIDTTIVVGGFFGCYDLVYPFDIITIDNETVTVENEDDFFNLLLNGTLLDFAYPLSLVDEDGNVTTVNDAEELNEAIEECFDFPVYEGLHAHCFILGSSIFGLDCYELVYPFTVVAEDGSTMTINDATEAEAFINDPNTLNYTVELPVSIVMIGTGETEVIESEEDLYMLLADCDGGGGPSQGMELDAFIFIGESSVFGGECYELIYPFNVIDFDGNTMAINDAAAAEALITNPGNYYMVQVPVSVKLIDTGDTVEVTSFEAFFDLLVNCN